MKLQGIKPSLLKSLIAKSIHLLVIFSYFTLTLAPNYALATQTTPEEHFGRSASVPYYKIRVTPVEGQRPSLRITRKLGEERTDLTPQISASSALNRASPFTTLIAGLGNLTVHSDGTLTLSQEGLQDITASLSLKSFKPLNLKQVKLKHLKSNTNVRAQHQNHIDTLFLQRYEACQYWSYLLNITNGSKLFAQTISMQNGNALIAGSLLSYTNRPFKIDASDGVWSIKPSGKIITQELSEGFINSLQNAGEISLSYLKVYKGHNQGRISTTVLSVDNRGIMTNTGTLTTNTLSGLGAFVNHADFKGLTSLKISHFYNQVAEDSTRTPDLSSGSDKSTTLEVGPEVKTFINGKGAQITYSSLNFLASGTEHNLPAFHNQGNVTVHYSFHSHNRNLINDGFFSVRGLELNEGVTLRNNLTGTLILKDGINTLKTGSILNEGEVRSQRTLNTNGLRHLGINQGTWIHSGDVVPADKNKGYEIKGRVHLKGGNLIPDHFRTGESIVFHNQGHLTLDLVMYPPFFDSSERPTLSLINHDKLTLYPTILVPIETENTGHLRLYLRIEDEGFFHSQLFRRFVSPGRFTILTTRRKLPPQFLLHRVSALEKLMGAAGLDSQGLKLHIKASLKKHSPQDTPTYNLKAFWQKGRFRHLLWKKTLQGEQNNKNSRSIQGTLNDIGGYTFNSQGDFSLTNRKQSKRLPFLVHLTMPGAVTLQDLYLPQLEVTARTVSFDDSIKIPDLTLTPLDPSLEAPFCTFAPSAVVQSNQVTLNGGLSQNFGTLTTANTSLTVALNQGQLENHSRLKVDKGQGRHLSFKGEGQFLNLKEVEAPHIDSQLQELANNGSVNAKTMALQGDSLINRGKFQAAETVTLKVISVDNTDGAIHAGGTVTGTIGQLQNQRGSLSGATGTGLTLENGFANQDGEIGAGGATELHFAKPLTVHALGTVQGDTTRIEAPSDSQALTLNNGTVVGETLVRVDTDILTAPGVSFATPRLELNVADFNLDPQGAVDRTIIQRGTTQNFKLTHPYHSTGTLEFWQQGLEDEEAVKAAMQARFGDGSGELPAAKHTLELQANVHLGKGLQFYMPAAKLRIGDNEADSFVDINLSHTTLTAYLSDFDLEKGSIAVLNARVHAPLGNTLGRLVIDPMREVFMTFFSHSLTTFSSNLGNNIINVRCHLLDKRYTNVYDGHHLVMLPAITTNGSTFTVRNRTELKGPLRHHGTLNTKDLLLDSCKDSYAEASRINIKRHFTLQDGGNLYLKRILGTLEHTYYFGQWVNYSYPYVSSDAAWLWVGGTLAADPRTTIFNQASNLYFQQKSPETKIDARDHRGGAQKFIQGTKEQRRDLNNHPYSGGYPSNITLPTNGPMYSTTDYQYAAGFLVRTNNFAGTQSVFPANQSSGEGIVLPADGTMLEGNFTAPLMLIPVEKGGLILGSRNPYYIPKQASVRDLLAKGFNLNTTYITDNLRELIEAEASPQFHFKIRERFWFNATKAQQFYQDIQDHVVVRNQDGLFRRPQPNALFSLSPKLLLETVQEQCQEALMRGYIYEQDGQRTLDMDLLKHLHRNTTAYLEQIGFNSDNFAQALVTRGSKPQFPLPSEPMIYYLSTSNEQELEELRPWVYFPEAMIDEARGKRGGKIRTHMLAIIEAGMLPREMINAIQDPRMQLTARKFFDNHPDVARLITERADEYWRLKALEAAPQKKQLTNAGTDNVNPASGPLQVHPDEEEQEENQEGRVEIVSQSVKRIEGPGPLRDYATYAVDFGEATADPGRGVHASYTVHPTPADGNCFFHAAFTQPRETAEQVTARAAQIRNSIPRLIRSNPAYLEMLRPEVLAGINQAFTTYEVRWERAELMPKPPRPDHISARLWDMAYDNYVYRYQREAAIAADKEAKSQTDYGKSFAALTPEQKNKVNNAAQAPAALRASERYSTDAFLATIEDDVVLDYAKIYTDPTTFIEMPPTRSEKNSSGHLIALEQGIRINRFCFNKDTGKLTYNGFVGQEDSRHIVNVLFKDFHFWRLVNEDQENPDRTLAIRQATQNDSDESSSLALLANSAKALERQNRSANTPSPSGSVTIHGEVEADKLGIFTGGKVTIHADIKAREAALVSLFNDVIFQSQVGRYGNAETFVDYIAAPARIHVEKMLQIFAGNNVVFQGAETKSGLGTYIHAIANVLDLPVKLVRQQTIHHYGKYKGIEQFTEITNHVSCHHSDQKIEMVGGGVGHFEGTRFFAKSGEFLFVSDINFNDVHTIRQHFIDVAKKGGSFSRSKSITGQSCAQTSQGVELNFEEKCQATTLTGQVSATNPTLNCPLTKFKAPQGKARLNAGVNTLQSSYATSSSNAAWQKQKSVQENHRTYSLPRINGTLEIEAQETIAQGIQGQTLEYLNQIKLNNGKLTPEILHELHEVDVKKVQGPSAALSIIISIGAALATYGVGAKAGGAVATALKVPALAAPVVKGAVSAAINTLISQAAISCVTHQGDLGKVAQELTSGKKLRLLRNAIIKALVLGDGSSPKNLSFGDLLIKHALRSLKEAGLNMVLEGTKPEDALKAILQNTATGAIGTYFANKIGDAYKPSNPTLAPQLDWLTHKIAHACLGGTLGAIMGDKDRGSAALAGAAGAVAAEVVAEAITDNALKNIHAEAKAEGKVLTEAEFQERFSSTLEMTTDWGRLGAAVTALVTDLDANIATATAANAVNNNLIPMLVAVGYVAYVAYDVYDTYQEKGLDAAVLKLGFEVGMVASGTVAGAAAVKVYQLIKTVPKIVKGVVVGVERIVEISAPNAKIAWAMYMEAHPGIAMALNKLMGKVTAGIDKVAAGVDKVAAKVLPPINKAADKVAAGVEWFKKVDDKLDAAALGYFAKGAEKLGFSIEAKQAGKVVATDAAEQSGQTSLEALRQKVIQERNLTPEAAQALGFRGEMVESLKKANPNTGFLKAYTEMDGGFKEAAQMMIQLRREMSLQYGRPIKIEKESISNGTNRLFVKFENGNILQLRPEGKSGHVKLEITDTVKNIFEKITFIGDK